MIDSRFFAPVLSHTWTINLTIALATFLLALIVYVRRREVGFLLLVVVLGYRLLDATLIACGINITAMLARPPIGISWFLIYVPPIVTLAGWLLLAIKGKKDA